jgi:acetolactate decarboxylase
MRSLAAALAFTLICAHTAPAEDRMPGRDGSLFQVSTLDALLAGDFTGRVRFRMLERRGDFGLGTFDRLDGEMIALDGTYHRVRFDGSVSSVAACETTPFAAVTFFEPESSFKIEDAATCADIYEAVEARFLPSDVPLAIRITGSFPKLETRSVPPQSEPFPPLSDVVAQQNVFDLYDVDATLVGFWFPETYAGVNAAGFHFHALTEDKQSGGHVLGCQPGLLEVAIDPTPRLTIDLARRKSTAPPPARCRR